ncbi:Avd_like domain containing protein [Candidatus Nanopelagicaceae bacterium]
MALYQDLPVFADVYTLTHKVFLFTQDYPREYKFTLGQDMKRDCLVLLRSIYRINKSSDKVVHLEAFLDDFELLKLEIRLSGDLKLLPTKKHSELIVLMDSIGKQITGWRNASLRARISSAKVDESEQ